MTKKLQALDLFCGAGGATRGLQQAGFEVLGIDLAEQPAYIGEKFYHGDVFKLLPSVLKDYRFDLIWASPPCQAFTAYKRRKNHVKPCANLIPETREALLRSSISYIIENVAGAPLRAPTRLCGSMFGLDVRRHRFFETTFPVHQLPCAHETQTPRFPPATNRKNLRSTVEVGVWRIPLETQKKAMGIDWMELEELSQAIPPAYADHLATVFLRDYRRRS